MNRGNKCGSTKVELVHKQITPVPAKSLYEEAIARGEFIGTFAEYQEFMRDTVATEGLSPLPVYNDDIFEI